ncbi:MAG: VOC family protein, partial [Mycobacteriaceae bacterium]|nr:VOC family protein [Mycobacteriaceae bacterium]
MAINFNHTIVAAHDKKRSATFLTELFDLPSPAPFAHFLTVTTANGVSLDYADVAEGEEIRPQH